MDLAQPLVGDDLQPGAVGEHRGGLITPRQITGIQTARPIGSKNLRCADRLGGPHLIDGDVCLTLEAVDYVPLGATVAPEDDPRRCHRRSSTRSSISGQSRHNLSSA
jgi:hypothetical protein